MNKLLIFLFLVVAPECLAFHWKASYRDTATEIWKDLEIGDGDTLLFSDKPKYFCMVTKKDKKNDEGKISESRFIACGTSEFTSMTMLTCNGYPQSQNMMIAAGGRKWAITLVCHL